jgi:hypothetical protein
VKTFVLVHEHTPAECPIAYAAWSGFDSPLRGRSTHSTCARFRSIRTAQVIAGPLEHETWWTVEASDADAALGLLPPYVRERTRVREVSELTIG